jgi:hypothetical protein
VEPVDGAPIVELLLPSDDGALSDDSALSEVPLSSDDEELAVPLSQSSVLSSELEPSVLLLLAVAPSLPQSRLCAASAVAVPCPTGRPELAAPVVELDRLVGEPLPSVPELSVLPEVDAPLLELSEPVLEPKGPLLDPAMPPAPVPDVMPLVLPPVAAALPAPDCANAPALANATVTAVATIRIECRMRTSCISLNKDRPPARASVYGGT